MKIPPKEAQGEVYPTQSSDELTQTVEMPTQSGSGKPAKGKDSNAKGLGDVRKNIQLSEHFQKNVKKSLVFIYQICNNEGIVLLQSV